MKYRSIKNSFLGGQISPTVWGRTDLPSYPHSCRELINMIPKKSGGSYRRPGNLSMVTFPMTGFTSPRMIPFVINRQQPYAVVLYNTVAAGVVGAAGYSVYRPKGDTAINNVATATVSGTPPYNVATLLTSAASISAAFANGLGVDDEIQAIQYVQSADVLWLTHPFYKPQKILHTGTDTFKFVSFDTDNTGTALTGLALLQAYPYLNQNTSAITFQPSAVTGAGVTLTASAAINGGVGFVAAHIGAIFVINQAGHIGAIKITSITNTTHAVGTVIVDFFTAATAYTTWWESAWSDYRGWPKSCTIFQQRLIFGGTKNQPDTSWCTLVANYLKFSVLGDTIPAAVDPNGTVVPAGATVVNTPAGGVYTAPVDDSAGDGQTTGPTGAQPFRITLSQNTLDQIQWYSPDAQFLIGTQAQEWLIAPQNGSFDVANYVALVQSKYGSSGLPAKRIGYELMFIMGSGDEVRAYQYNFVDSSFFAEPVQLLFDEYPKALSGAGIAGRRNIKAMEWDVSRDCLWCIDMAGNLFGMTRDRKLSVTAWHTHQIGGFNAAQGQQTLGMVGDFSLTVDAAYYTCDGSVTSIAVLPNPFSQMNDLWQIVKRTIGGTVNWQMERMIGKGTTKNSAYEIIFPGQEVAEPLMIDAAYSGISDGTTQTFAVGANLNGYSLTGTYYNSKSGVFKVTTGVVSGGNATINSALPSNFALADGSVAWMTLGLPFTPRISPVPPEAGSQLGTAQGAIHAVSRVFLRVYKSLTAQVGSQTFTEGTYSGPDAGEDRNAAERVVFQDWTQPIGLSPEFYTGLKQVYPPSTWARDDGVYIKAEDPLPFEIQSVIYEAEEYDQS